MNIGRAEACRMYNTGAPERPSRLPLWAVAARAALRGARGRDLAIVLGLVFSASALCVIFDLNDSYAAWALAVERDTDLPVDELPSMCSFSALAFAWFARPRWREAP